MKLMSLCQSLRPLSSKNSPSISSPTSHQTCLTLTTNPSVLREWFASDEVPLICVLQRTDGRRDGYATERIGGDTDSSQCPGETQTREAPTMTILPITQLTEEEQMLREMVARFAQESIGPYVQEMEQAKRIKPEIIKECFDLGLMGISIPEEYGGTGLSIFASALVIEEVSKIDPSVALIIDVQNTLVNNVFDIWANEDQKKRFLTRLTTDTIGSYCLSESNSGSDAFALQTRAKLDPSGKFYKLNGSKLWITNGDEAGIFIVFATVDPDAGYRGITAFIVERDTEGFEVGKREDKLGIRASSTVPLSFEDCIVPVENVLGPVGKGYKIAIETLNEGRIGIGAQMIGLSRGALDSAMTYMLERKQFGKPLAHFQGLQFQFAECGVDLEAARLMVYNAARLKDADQPFVKEAAMAKLFASRIAERITSQCIEFHGGVGFTTEYPVEKFFRDAKIGSIYEGTSNMQLQTIAKLMLREYS